jgi:hypothetical protein
MTPRGLNTVVLMCAAGICAQALGFIKLLEGWANVDIVVATSDVVVCSKRVSGAEDELFALDTLGKKVFWRKSGYAVTRGETDGRGNFLIIEPGNKLASRKLKNGEVNWRIDIAAAIPKDQRTRDAPPDPNSTRSRGTRYKYRGPFIRGEKAFVFRQAREGYVDLWTVLFHDWLLFDTADGQLLHHGNGECVGLAGDVLVVASEDNTITAVSSSDYGQREIYRDQTPGRLTARPMDGWSRGSPAIQYSDSGRCIFNITHSPGLVSRTAIYDSSSKKLTVIEPLEKPKLQADWILLSDYTIWYSVTGRIAVYGADGKLMRERKLDPPTDADRGKLLFAGTSGNGSLIFRRGARLLVFDVPSLELTSDVKRQASAPSGDVFIKRGSDVIYSVEGSTALEKMPAEQLTRKITVNLTSLKSGGALWTYTEEVTIKKHQTATPSK